MTSEESEEAARLLRAARSDLRALHLLAADPEQSNDVVGFHAQQAVEKALKAVLVSASVEIPLTHDLGYILELLPEALGEMPASVARADWLTPWAVAARYGGTDGALNREAAITVAAEAVRWATRNVDGESL